MSHLTSETNTLWQQGPAGRFRDQSNAWGLTAVKRRGTGFGTVMADFDHNGTLDIAVVNGRVTREQFSRAKPGLACALAALRQRNQVLSNTGRAFRDVSHNNPALCGHFTVCAGWRAGTWMPMGRRLLVKPSASGAAVANVAGSRELGCRAGN